MKNGYLKCIRLVWRKSKGERRIIVGTLSRSSSEGITFNYELEGIKEASKYGFVCYPDFPILEKEYHDNVLDVFGQRLNNSERSDIQNYYDFWEIAPEYKQDKFYLLAQTQGLLSTDNFEFLAEYNLERGIRFISEISGITNYKIASNTLQEGDLLKWEKEPANKYDSKAVKVLKNGVLLGYVKRIHSKIFYDKRADLLQIQVKSLEKNGHITRAFITIYAESR